MKKYLFVLAAAVVALASCNGGGGNKYTSIKFKNTELTVAEGASGKLQVLYEPTELDPPTCEWSTSNAEAVTVDQNGTIEAVAVGEANITAKVGELTAVCKITVVDPLDMVAWGGFSLWDLDPETVLSNDTMVTTLSDGTEVHCVMVPALYYVWDDGVVYTSGVGLSGSGYLVEAEGTTWLIADSIDENGPMYYYLSNRKYTLTFKDYDTFNWQDTANAYCAVTTKLGDAAKHLEWYNNETSTVDDATEIMGARIHGVNFDAGKYTSIFSGLIGPSIFLGDKTVAYYQANFGWFDYHNTAYGLKFVQDEATGEWSPKEPAEWGDIIPKYYESLPQSSTQKAPEAVAPVKLPRPTKNLAKDVLVHM